MAARQRDWPAAMTTLSTHDTKRGEDVRARITVLAEVPDVWAGALDKLLRLVPLPDSALRIPAVAGDPRRLAGGRRRRRPARAAARVRREGDARGRRPDHLDRARRHLRGRRAPRRRRGLRRAGRPPACSTTCSAASSTPGWSNALAAKLVALTMPGVPDVYQGSELWEQSLVDPDNRRPVDFESRAALLAELDGGARPRLTGGVDDPGAAKLLVTRAALRLRRDQPELFTGYAPLAASGEAAAPRARLRPRRRRHRRHPAAARPRGPRRLGRHDAGPAAGRVGRRDQRSRGRRRRRRSRRAAGRLPGRAAAPAGAGAGARPDRTRSLRRVGAAARPGAAERRRRRRADGARRGRLVAADRPGARAGEVDYGYLARRRPGRQARPALAPAAARGARAVAHVRPGGVHLDATARGPAASSRGRRSTSCTSAPSPPRAPSTPLSAGSTTCKEIGVDLVELMPVNAVNGEHNWGYDGVLWSAVHEAYGGPAAYQRFVDGCHAAGLGVIQDVVHNHLGPSGNYLPLFAPYLKEGRSTWGDLRQPRRRRAAPRCGGSSSTTCGCGSRTSTSTGCGSTPCTRCTTSRRCTCWRRWRSRSPRCRRTTAGR